MEPGKKAYYLYHKAYGDVFKPDWSKISASDKIAWAAVETGLTQETYTRFGQEQAERASKKSLESIGEEIISELRKTRALAAGWIESQRDKESAERARDLLKGLIWP